MKSLFKSVFFAAAISLITAAPPSGGTEPLVITIENHVFHPTEIHVPANTKFEFKVKNLDDSAEEFESPGLKVEKVVPAKSEVLIRLKPVAEGRYTFVGEYHEKTARGLAVVK